MYSFVFQAYGGAYKEELKNRWKAKSPLQSLTELGKQMWRAFIVAAPSTFMCALMLGHLHIPGELGPRFRIRSFPCCNEDQM
jgi:hypothetical protein